MSVNWADSQIQKVSEKAKEQAPYGSRNTLLFGLTMLSFFIVSYMTINNFVFRAMCVRYLFYPLPILVVYVGYVFCVIYLLLAFYSFLVYFRIAKPVGKEMDLMHLIRLGLPLPNQKSSSSSGRGSKSPIKNLLPLPAWATESTSPSSETPQRDSGSRLRSPMSSSKVTLSTRKANNFSSSPTSPKGRSKASPSSSSTPKDSYSWLTRSQTPTRLSSPLNYPSTLTSPGASTSRPLSPNGMGAYPTPKAFPKMESPMVRRYGDVAEGIVYANSPLASPSVTSPARYATSPSNYYTPGSNTSRSRNVETPHTQATTFVSSPLYTSPRATSSFSIEDYTSSMSPLSTYGSPRDGTRMRNTPNSDFSFSDVSQLDEYIERQKRIDTTKEYLNPENSNGGATRTGLRAIKMPVYQSIAIRKASDKPSNSKEGAYMDDRLAMALYAKEGVTNHMEIWTENLRAWMSGYVLKPLVEWFDVIVEQMGKDALYQAQFSQVQSGVQKLQTQQASMFSIKPTLVGAGTTTTQSQQQQQQQHLQQRMRLERLFGDFGTSREYVVERIRALSLGAIMQCYNWSAGGKWKDKEWSTDLPTDAAIISHLFGCHLDELVVPTDSAHVHDAFRSRYLVSKDETTKKPPFAIVQRSVNPPHYNIVVNNVEWNILRGRNNLFAALCLFIFVVRRDYKGVLDQRYLGGPIGLLDVLTDDIDD